MKEIHTEKYGQADRAPLTAWETVIRCLARDWGTEYTIGLIGRAQADTCDPDCLLKPSALVFVFQVCARDSSRFALWADSHGEVGSMKGRKALEWLQSRGIEASVWVSDEEDDRHPGA